MPAPERRIPPPLTAEALRKLAEGYVLRFGGPAANLRRVLGRHVRRSVRDHGSDAAALAAEVEALVARFTDARLLDDAAYAEGKARSLQERGKSRRWIAQSLRQKGVGGEDVAHAMRELDADPDASELASARALVRRRRLGWMRPEAERGPARQKDLGVIVRAGFAFGIAKRALDRESDEEEE